MVLPDAPRSSGSAWLRALATRGALRAHGLSGDSQGSARPRSPQPLWMGVHAFGRRGPPADAAQTRRGLTPRQGRGGKAFLFPFGTPSEAPLYSRAHRPPAVVAEGRALPVTPGSPGHRLLCRRLPGSGRACQLAEGG